MTIAENVAQAELGIDRERGKKCLSLAGLEQKITQLPKEIDTHLGQVYEDGIRLPGGEAQRLMLARALYKSAPVIVLDDPQSGSSFFMRYARKEDAGKGKRFPLYKLLSTFYSPRTFYD